MTHTIPDLWPADITVSTIIAPVTILRQQAGILGQKTKNLVEADVRSKPSQVTEDHFVHDFYLVAPALDYYQIYLFSISHPIEFYPLTVTNRKGVKKVESEAEFLKALKEIFASDETKKIITSLISQSQT